MEQATFGGGCFWCLEAVFEQTRGVQEVVSGYAGGTTPDPTYEQVCSGATGHAEVVQITFDPDVIAYPDLLAIFFAIHDPTTPDRQGADVGSQYRSAVFTHDAAQETAVREVIDTMTRDAVWPDPIVTEVSPLDTFYPAEPYHQHYYQQHRTQPYCRLVIDPKLAKFRKTFADRDRGVDPP